MNDRRGFSLLEVLIALVILGFVILGAQATLTGRMVSDIGWQETRARATQLAMDRLHLVQSDPAYGTLATRYTGTETGLPGAPGFTRTTQFSLTPLDAGQEYRTVTVTVTAPRLTRPVARTAVIASP
jgi:prepilin-type N-terminal cleavage/methylation domain-containing protein